MVVGSSGVTSVSLFIEIVSDMSSVELVADFLSLDTSSLEISVVIVGVDISVVKNLRYKPKIIKNIIAKDIVAVC